MAGEAHLNNVLNLETGGIVWMGEARYDTTMLVFFDELIPGQRSSIEAIAVYMWRLYRRAAAQACAQDTLVVDLFHVVAKYGREAIDWVRADEGKRQKTENAAVW